MRVSPGSLLLEFRRNPGTALVASGLALAVALAPALFVPALYDDFTLIKQASLLVAAAVVLTGLAWDGELWPRSRTVRYLLAGWAALLVLSFLTATDQRGSILGYYQYRQGLLTQVSYIVLFLGALKLARAGRRNWLAVAGIAGLVPVTAYTAVQALGRDPVDWWIDTSARAIGTIGNANELAAYAVLGLAFCGALGSSTRGRLATAGVAACASFIVLESESRSGLLALAIVVVVLPAAVAVARHPWRPATRSWLMLVVGLAAGAVLSLVAGGAAGTASRVQAGVAGPEANGSTRLELWKGTVSTIAASPLLGFGPDGLHLAFPRHRPRDLGGAFLDYDLTAQSSHNLALDVAANEGLPAMLVLAALFSTAAIGSAKRERGALQNPQVPFIWSAIAGYLALTMVNPVSLAPHAIFFILLGLLQGRTEQPMPAPERRLVPRTIRTVAATPAALSLIVVAALLPIADLRANRAWEHFSRGEFEQAAADYDSASSLMPFERTYAANTAGSWLAAGVDDGRPALQKAVLAYESFDRKFGFGSGECIGLATARIGLGATGGLDQLLAKSLSLNPHGITMAAYLAQLRLAAAQGGTLHYASRDHWVRVVPNSERATR